MFELGASKRKARDRLRSKWLKEVRRRIGKDIIRKHCEKLVLHDSYGVERLRDKPFLSLWYAYSIYMHIYVGVVL